LPKIFIRRLRFPRLHSRRYSPGYAAGIRLLNPS
jgi:hypothetical protein